MNPYKHFNTQERTMLKIYLSEGYTLRKISLVIGKNVSSLSREIKRNSYRNGNYDVSAAQRKYRKRYESDFPDKKYQFIYDECQHLSKKMISSIIKE